MPAETLVRPIEILLVEDNPADADLLRETLEQSKVLNNLHVAEDGDQALAMLRREPPHGDAARPDLILLDLNLPGIDGREVLQAIRADPELTLIPVVIVTSSKAEEDIARSYQLRANCYVTKPVDFQQFHKVVRTIEEFWLATVRLPPRSAT